MNFGRRARGVEKYLVGSMAYQMKISILIVISKFQEIYSEVRNHMSLRVDKMKVVNV